MFNLDRCICKACLDAQWSRGDCVILGEEDGTKQFLTKAGRSSEIVSNCECLWLPRSFARNVWNRRRSAFPGRPEEAQELARLILLPRVPEMLLVYAPSDSVGQFEVGTSRVVLLASDCIFVSEERLKKLCDPKFPAHGVDSGASDMIM